MLQIIRLANVVAVTIGLALGLVGPPPAVASENGTIQMRVIDIAANDVLNVREYPTRESQIVGIIPPNATGVTSLGEVVGTWERVRYERSSQHGWTIKTEGWVTKKFVVPEVAGWISTPSRLDRNSCARILNTVSSCKSASHCKYESMIEWFPKSDQEFLASSEAGTVFSSKNFDNICRNVCETKAYALQPTRATLCGY